MKRFEMPVKFVSREGRVVEPSRAYFKPELMDHDFSDVPYHGRLPLITPGTARAIAKSGSSGCYVALRIRTIDKEPDVRLLDAISKTNGIQLMLPGRGNPLPSARDSEANQMPVKIRLEKGYYEVSVSGMPYHKMEEAMRMVDAVGRSLLLNKEIGQEVEGRDSETLLRQLTARP